MFSQWRLNPLKNRVGNAILESLRKLRIHRQCEHLFGRALGVLERSNNATFSGKAFLLVKRKRIVNLGANLGLSKSGLQLIPFAAPDHVLVEDTDTLRRDIRSLNWRISEGMIIVASMSWPRG